MIAFLIYLLIGVFVTAAMGRVLLKRLSEYDRKNYSEKAWAPGCLIGMFWPIGLPIVLIWVGANKLLDKFTEL